MQSMEKEQAGNTNETQRQRKGWHARTHTYIYTNTVVVVAGSKQARLCKQNPQHKPTRHAKRKKARSLARWRPTNPRCNNNHLPILNFSSCATKMKNSPSKQTSTQCEEMPLKQDCNCVCRADQASVARQSFVELRFARHQQRKKKATGKKTKNKKIGMKGTGRES